VRGNWSAATAFLVAWFLAPFLIFTFYATQLPHYVLPGFPPFFLLLGREWKRLQRRRVSLGLAVALAAVSIPIAGAWLRPRTPAIALQETLATLPQDAELAFYRYQEPSLIFYTNRHFGSLHGLDELNAFAARPGPRAVVVLESEGERSYVSELRGLDAAGLQVRRVSGWNVARGKPVTVRCYFRMR
jgi:hypothetical protein